MYTSEENLILTALLTTNSYLYRITFIYNFKSMQGDAAPAFLSNIFSYNENSGALTISATTIELAGSLVIRGYCGVKQSLFVGGYPTKGEPSTEVAGGQLLLYGKDKGAVISGFTTSPQGAEISKLTVQGQLWEDPEGKGQPKRVATKIF